MGSHWGFLSIVVNCRTVLQKDHPLYQCSTLEAIWRSLASESYLLIFMWPSLLPVAGKKVALFNPEEGRWMQWVSEFQPGAPFRADTHALVQVVPAAGGPQLQGSVGTIFSWRELHPRGYSLSFNDRLIQEVQRPAPASMWGTTLKDSVGPEPPAGSSEASVCPRARPDKPPARVSPSQSLFPGSRLRQWVLLPSSISCWPAEWMACFSHGSSLLVGGWRWQC